MDSKEIIVGSRASSLALTQTNMVIDSLKKLFPEYTFKVKEIKTMGDKILDKTLNKIGGKGLFVKEIELALLKEEIDMAVHSMKDVPSQFPNGLEIGAITKREDERDALITKDNMLLKDLRQGAKIGTSSLRRAAQIKALREDIEIIPIRGNIQTRIGKIDELNLDGIVLAAAGIKRMGLDNNASEYLNDEQMIPAVGQGALGIEIRSNDEQMAHIVSKINDRETEYCINAERKFMEVLKGGCHVPIGAHCVVDDDTLTMVGIVASIDGNRVIKVQDKDTFDNYKLLGERIAKDILAKGGNEILKELEGDN